MLRQAATSFSKGIAAHSRQLLCFGLEWDSLGSGLPPAACGRPVSSFQRAASSHSSAAGGDVHTESAPLSNPQAEPTTSGVTSPRGSPLVPSSSSSSDNGGGRWPTSRNRVWNPCGRAAFHTSSSSCSSSGAGASSRTPEGSGSVQDALGLSHIPGITGQDVDQLVKVLLQPMPSSAAWSGQLNSALLEMNGQTLVEPHKVLISTIRALHVIRTVLAQDGHVYVVENHPLMKPLLRAAAHSCLNPNVWFYSAQWKPGMITNAASHKRFFKAEHQPNRRLLAARGLAMVNPHCPKPPALSVAPARLDWQGKWQLFKMTGSSQDQGSGSVYQELLKELVAAEEQLFKFKPQGSLRGEMRHLSLVVFLDSTRNAVGIHEAYQRNIPTVGLVNPMKDLSHITYPVLARDFHPQFVHFFLDWMVKVVNVAQQLH